MSIRAVYDEIGRGYAAQRRTDPRIAARLMSAIGDAGSVLNVGAGAGSYEPTDRRVAAVEPSVVMLRQRASGSAPAVRAQAEALPFGGRTFDAVLAVLTVHHWGNLAAGLAECLRVARRRVVLLTFDAWTDGFWLVSDYFPEFAEADRRSFAPIEAYQKMLGPHARVEISPLPVPRDCVDGFLGAYWARPDAYLDPQVRGGISLFARSGTGDGLERLSADLVSGVWHERFGHLLLSDELDLGYRLVVAELLD